MQGAATTAIVYVAGLFERVRETGEATKSVHYIFAGSSRIAIRTTDGAFGKRRIAAGASAWTDPALAIAAISTPRGFTGHEHLDDFQLVHMNGRVYDPALGRFMSADPFVQFAESTQGFNRYSYVDNNPLSFTDPSGYFIGKLFKAVGRFVKKVLGSGIGRVIAQLVATAAICGADPAFSCAAWVGAGLGGASAAAAGGDLSDVFKAAAVSFASAHAFRFVGHGLPLPENPGLLYLAKTLAHGVVGGVRSVASGGKFGPGFLSAGFTQLASPQIGRIGGDGFGGRSARVIAAAVVGGTASRLGGGKFANGASTGAFLWMYNHGNDPRTRKGTCLADGL